MNKQELIEELKKEIEVIRNNTDWEERTETYEKGKRIGLEIGWMLAEKLDEPELPEIPQFIADRIEEYKEIQFGISLIFMINRQIDDDVRFSKWLSSDKDNCELVCRSFLDGYAIEPPKTLQVIVKNYDNTVYKTELPEDEAMKLIEGWKG